MVFSSLEFLLIFLPIVLTGHHLILRVNSAYAPPFLLISSFTYYGYWNIDSLAVLVFLALVTWVLSKQLECCESTLGRKTWLFIIIAINLGALAWFKYANFVLSNIRVLFSGVPDTPAILLPLGISFFVFQKIAYAADLASGKSRTGRFFEFSLFVSFFPQLIAGPIVHWRELAPQLTPQRMIFQLKFSLGLSIFIIGLAKKTFLADPFSEFVAAVFDNKEILLSTFVVWKAVLAYTLQIYFDFSGYSDMAVGIALMLGIYLPWNFNSPYKAANIVEFWRRWHITLSKFLRDYLYIPLGGNRVKSSRRFTNILLTMLLGGLWHGAGWTFIVWGAIHGLAIVICHAWRNLGYIRFPAVIAHLITFFIIALAWVFFRAPDLSTALTLVKAMFGIINDMPSGHAVEVRLPTMVAIFGMLLIFFAPNTRELAPRLSNSRLGMIFCGVMLAATILRQSFVGEASEFIYFRF